jgi:hypothetical protein
MSFAVYKGRQVASIRTAAKTAIEMNKTIKAITLLGRFQVSHGPSSSADGRVVFMMKCRAEFPKAVAQDKKTYQRSTAK